MTRTYRPEVEPDRHLSKNGATRCSKKAGFSGWGNFNHEFEFEMDGLHDCELELEASAEPVDPLLLAVQQYADREKEREERFRALQQAQEDENTIIFTAGFAPRRRATTLSSLNSDSSDGSISLNCLVRQDIMKSDKIDLSEIARTSTIFSKSVEPVKTLRLADF